MRRRSQSGGGVSLFVFQDVLTAVIGVMILLVLLLALELGLVAGVVGSDQKIPKQLTEASLIVEDLQQALEYRRTQIRNLKTELAELALLSEADVLQHMARSRGKLTEIRDRRDEVNRDTERIWKRLREAADSDEDLSKKIDARTALRVRAEALKDEINNLERNPRLVYRVAPGIGKEPIVVVAEGERVRIGGVQSQSAAIDLGMRGDELPERLFVDLLNQHSPKSSFVYLIAKPSIGKERLEQLRGLIREQGFEIGFDLLPEHWLALGDMRGVVQ